MKGLLTAFFLCITMNTWGQKHQLTAGTFIPPLSTAIAMYEYNPAILNGKLGMGLMYLFRNPAIVAAKEFSVGPRLNYYLVKKKAGDIYVGTGLFLGELNGIREWDYRLQGGINVNLKESFAIKFEMSNHMLIDNGPVPTGGLTYKF